MFAEGKWPWRPSAINVIFAESMMGNTLNRPVINNRRHGQDTALPAPT